MPLLLQVAPPDIPEAVAVPDLPADTRVAAGKGGARRRHRSVKAVVPVEAHTGTTAAGAAGESGSAPVAAPLAPAHDTSAADEAQAAGKLIATELEVSSTQEVATAAKVTAYDTARAIDAGDRSWIKVLLLTALGLAATFALGRSGWFSARDDVGYYLGLVGGVLMLSLLAYPLRKYLTSFRRLGAVKYWFAVHMVIGICAPLLILLHSTFRLGSTNSAVALICMLIVAASGIVGRFLYTKVHRGLYGEKLNLDQLQATSGLADGTLQSALHEAPAVEARLLRFEKYARRAYGSNLRDVWRFATIGSRRSITRLRCMYEFERVVRLGGGVPARDSGDYHRRIRAADELVDSFLASAQRISQFTVYERLLRLWHVAHVPLVYLLAISSVAHVVAVHLY